jgi:hypothetical protein
MGRAFLKGAAKRGAPSLYIRTRRRPEKPKPQSQCRPRLPGPASDGFLENAELSRARYQFEPNGDQGFGAGCGVTGAGSDAGNDCDSVLSSFFSAFFFGADFFFADFFLADFFFAARFVFLAARFTFDFLAFFFFVFFFALRFFFAMTDL